VAGEYQSVAALSRQKPSIHIDHGAAPNGLKNLSPDEYRNVIS